MNSLGRGGVVVAMSSGLVATMGLPAQAVTQNAAGPEAASPAVAPAAAPVGAAFQTALLTAPTSFDASGAPLTAPTAAKVAFETGDFKAVPKAEPRRVAAPTTTASHSSAGTSSKATVKRSSESASSGLGASKGSSIISVASRYVGTSYRYGGTTPSGFDCSGYTSYVYRQVGKSIPRTAHQQMLASTRISRSAAKAGDLVFFVSGGRASHVGIVAGNGYMYDAGSSGGSVTKRKIYSSNVVYGTF
jgi:cell wall-associated NlpC family hydrolase